MVWEWSMNRDGRYLGYLKTISVKKFKQKLERLCKGGG